MKTYKLVIAYDGSSYCGWQSQVNKLSVSQVLNDSFKSTFGKFVRIVGASRTDAGVHALGQVVRIETDMVILAEKLRFAWNNALPFDIVIRSIKEIDKSFNPFFGVESKIYHYHFFINRPLPFLQRYGYYHPYPINIDLLYDALQFFVGTHDFRSFRSSEDMRSNTIRTIDSIDLEHIKRYNVYRIVIKGQKFLRHMIRRIVGASFAVATRTNVSLAYLKLVMEARDPSHVLPNAPAQGLLLYKIIYKNHM